MHRMLRSNAISDGLISSGNEAAATFLPNSLGHHSTLSRTFTVLCGRSKKGCHQPDNHDQPPSEPLDLMSSTSPFEPGDRVKVSEREITGRVSERLSWTGRVVSVQFPWVRVRDDHGVIYE